MFAYCNNNSVILIDPEGDDPWSWLPYWGYIHWMVQKKIQKDASALGISLILEQEITLADGKTGRVDIYNPATNEIWEVKSMGPASLEAERQLKKYRAGTIEGSTEELRSGAPQFFGVFECGRFTVAYYSPQPGVVLYKFWSKRKKDETHLDPAFVPLMILCPAPAPVKSSREFAFDFAFDIM